MDFWWILEPIVLIHTHLFEYIILMHYAYSMSCMYVLCMYTAVCICMYECMYVCMYVCTYVCEGFGKKTEFEEYC